MTTNCKGELRFTSTIARRLDSLGALTRGQRQTGGQNLFDPADNLESEYAMAALLSWFHLLAAGKLKSVNLLEFMTRTGLELMDTDGVLKEELPPIQRWLIHFTTLYNPSLQFGRAVQVDSGFAPANGHWCVYSLAHRLESQIPGGEWFTDVECLILDHTP